VPHADRAAFEAYARSRGFGRGGLYGGSELGALLAGWRTGADSSVEGSLYESLLEEVLWGVASAALHDVHHVRHCHCCILHAILLLLAEGFVQLGFTVTMCKRESDVLHCTI
jgi:hypothetical protein